MKKLKQILKEIYDELGMDRNEPGTSKLMRNIYLLDDDHDGQIIDAYWFKTTKIKANGTGTEEITVQCHPSCQTCKQIIKHPETRIIGMTQCCHSHYCNSEKCFSENCLMCDNPACTLCAKAHWQENRRIYIHHDCKSEFISLIESNLPRKLRKLPLAMKINLVGRKDYE